jgi:hypothetical protein
MYQFTRVKKRQSLEYYKQLLRDYIHCRVTLSNNQLNTIIETKKRMETGNEKKQTI